MVLSCRSSDRVDRRKEWARDLGTLVYALILHRNIPFREALLFDYHLDQLL